MNIFYLHKCPVISAKAMTNKHVVKMILESAQLLSTAHRMIDGNPLVGMSSSGRKSTTYQHPDPVLNDALYKATHYNHPSAVWSRECSANYHWLYDHFVALCDEYTHRYGKIHLCETKLKDILAKAPKNITVKHQTVMPQAMPEEYKRSCSVEAYRAYYEATKLKLDVDIIRYKDVLGLN